MGKSAKTATKKAKEEKWKQEREKLVEIMGKLDNPDVVGYFYRFVTGKLYREPECPASLICEIEKIHKEIEDERQDTKEPLSEEERDLLLFEKFVNQLRFEIISLLEQIPSFDVLRYIKIIVEDIVKDIVKNPQDEAKEQHEKAQE